MICRFVRSINTGRKEHCQKARVATTDVELSGSERAQLFSHMNSDERKNRASSTLLDRLYSYCSTFDQRCNWFIRSAFRNSLFDSSYEFSSFFCFQVAAYLDPFTLNEMSIDEIKVAESLLLDEMKNAKKTVNVLRTAQQSSAASSTSKKDSRTTLLSTIQKFKISCNNAVSLGSLSQVPPPSKELSLKEEISMYLSTCKTSNDWQGFWNDHHRSMPLLASFVRRYGIIPATSVASESAFSVAGYLHRKQRSSLSPSTLRYLMVLKKSW